MVEFLIGIITLVVLTVVINKTTEDRFHAIKPHLREIWWVLGFIYVAYWLFRAESERYFMALKHGFGMQHPFGSYVLAALMGMALFVSYWGLLGALFPIEAKSESLPEQHPEPKKPDVQQNSQGNNSPNIVGDGATVNYGDPKVAARLDEITRLLKAQGGKDKLLEKYPLGYVIYDVDYVTDAVTPLDVRKGLEAYQFDFRTVHVTAVGNQIAVQLPDLIKDKQLVLKGNRTGGPKRVGDLGGYFMADKDGVGVQVWGEILAINGSDITFLVGLEKFHR